MPTTAESTNPNNTSSEVALAATASGCQCATREAKIAVGAGSTNVGTLRSRIANSQNMTSPTASANAGARLRKLWLTAPRVGAAAGLSVAASVIGALACGSQSADCAAALQPPKMPDRNSFLPYAGEPALSGASR